MTEEDEPEVRGTSPWVVVGVVAAVLVLLPVSFCLMMDLLSPPDGPGAAVAWKVHVQHELVAEHPWARLVAMPGVRTLVISGECPLDRRGARAALDAFIDRHPLGPWADQGGIAVGLECKDGPLTGTYHLREGTVLFDAAEER